MQAGLIIVHSDFSLVHTLTEYTLSLSIVSLNARGLRENVKRKALFLFAKQQKSDFYFFQESHSVVNDTLFWKSQWGNEIWFSHGTERSAGAAILKYCFNGSILHSESDLEGHYLILIINIDNFIVLLANVYGYNSKTGNDFLFDVLETRILYWISRYPNILLIIGGDFNIALNGLLDRWPPSSEKAPSNLITFMQGLNLIDIWREKNDNTKLYTWSNKAETSMSRIDLWLVSSCLDRRNITRNIVTTPLTDHKAVVLQVSLNSNIQFFRSSYWKLNNSLLKHETVNEMVQKLINHFWTGAGAENNYVQNWELLKFEVAKFMRKFGATCNHQNNHSYTNSTG